MAQLLSVRSLTPDLPPLTSPISRLPLFECPQRSQSTISLVKSDRSQSTSDKETQSFQNPVFQSDDLSAGQDLRSPESTESSEVHDDSLKRGLSPSDSGILIPDDAASIKSGKSLDSGLDEPRAASPADTKITVPSNDGDAPPLENGKKEDSPQRGGGSRKEGIVSLCVQVIVPFLIAGFGTCGAGLILDYVEGWNVFGKVTELYILVPTLLGLKGNLEMTLASRMSTQANLGKLDSISEKWRMSWGNMALVQCQATVLALLASSFATAISSASGFNLERTLLLGASALFTGSVASLLLGLVTLAVVFLSQRFKVNPDNIATPIAASLGDITTLGILASIADYLYEMQGNLIPSSICLVIFLALVPVWFYFSYQNSYVKRVLFSGWAPVIAAVIITSAGGYILEYSVTKFKGLAVFQPVINGVAGNLVAVQASRISTYFHKHTEPGSMPPDGSNLCISPFHVFLPKNPHSRTATILLIMVAPGHVMFAYFITFLKSGDTVLTPTFLLIYVIAAVIQVLFLLYIAQCLINFLWRWKMDPDNWAIPLLTALGDLSGMVALTSAFFVYSAVKKP